MTTTNSSKKKIARRRATSATAIEGALASGDVLLGSIVFWPSLEGVKMTRAAFRQVFEDVGLGDALGRDPKPEACLNKAAAYASLATSQGFSKGRKAPIRVEMKEKNKTHATYSVLVRDRMSDGRTRYLEEARIICERWVERPKLTVITNPKAGPNAERDRVIDAVVDRYDTLLHFALTPEMSKTLINAMRLTSSLALRTGVYFVPQANMATVEALRGLLARKAGVHVSAWSVASSGANLAEARNSAVVAMRDRLNEIKASAKELIDETPKGEGFSAKKLNARLRHLSDLENDAALYADILGQYATEVQVAVAEARKSLGGSVGDLFADPDED